MLLTGRGTSAQWHTGSRTDKSDVLRTLAPANCYVEINPADAARLGIAPETQGAGEFAAREPARDRVRHADRAARARFSSRCTTPR